MDNGVGVSAEETLRVINQRLAFGPTATQNNLFYRWQTGPDTARYRPDRPASVGGCNCIAASE